MRNAIVLITTLWMLGILSPVPSDATTRGEAFSATRNGFDLGTNRGTLAERDKAITGSNGAPDSFRGSGRVRDSDTANRHLRLAQYGEAKDRSKEASRLRKLGNSLKRKGRYDKALRAYGKSLQLYRELGDRSGEAAVLNQIGLVYAALGRYREALDSYKKSLAIRRQLKDRRGESHALNNLGIIYKYWGQYDKAIELYEQSLAIKKELGDRRGVSQSLNNLGNVYKDRSRYDKAVELYEQSLAIKRELGDRGGEAQTLNNLGIVYKKWGQYDKAIELYQQSLAIKKKLEDRRGEAQTLNNLGNVYKDWGRYDKAVELYHESLAIKKELGDRQGEAQTLNNLGIVYKNWGQYDKAVELYEKSLAIKKDLGDRRGESQTLNNLGIVYKSWGKYDKAVQLYERSLAIRRELGDRQGEAQAFNNLGIVYKNWGQYDKAVDLYEKSLAIKKELRDRRGEAQTFNNLGIVYMSWGQYNKAVKYYEKSLSLKKELRDRPGQAQTYNNLGIVYKNRGRYDKAVEFYEKSLELKRELKDPHGEGQTLNNLGIVYKDWGQYDKAIELLENSLAIRRRLKDRPGEGTTLHSLGTVYRAWGQYTRARQTLEKALAIYREMKDPLSIGRTLMNLGLIHQHMAQFDQALAGFKEGLEIWQRMKIPTKWPKNLIANLYLDMGDFHRAEPLVKDAGYWATRGRFFLLQSNYKDAKGQYEKLLKAAAKNRNADNLFTALTGLGLCYEGIEDNAKAAEHFGRAVAFTEEIRTSLTEAQREKFFDVRIHGFLRTVPYEGLARVLLKLKQEDDALKSSEYTKARLFGEALSKRHKGQSYNVPKTVLNKDRQLNEELAALKTQRQKAYETGDKLQIEALEPQIATLEDGLRAHIFHLRQKYPLFASTKYPEPMKLDQTELRPHEWVLSFDVTDPGLIVYLTKGKELVKAVFKPFPRKELNELVRAFREPLDIKFGDPVIEKLASFDFSSGKRLSDILLGDILPVLPEDTPVIIVPDDSLGVLPFEMLVLNDDGKVGTDRSIPYTTGARFFRDRNPISYYQSITALTLARMHGTQRASVKEMLVIADPVFGMRDSRAQESTQPQARLAGVQADLYKRLMAATEDGAFGITFPRLTRTGELAKDLAEIYRGRSRILTGFEAAKQTFDKTIVPAADRYDKIVFATHGYFGKDLPGLMEPVLVLTLVPPGTDGYLRMSEVMGLRLYADMVALTACQTGLGRRISGEGVMGMGRAFQYAGARAVLMSLWSVAEESSVELVESFFRHLEEGKTKLEALKLARNEIRQAGYDHPFFWAPFILVGEVD